jgi:hypothetical protein
VLRAGYHQLVGAWADAIREYEAAVTLEPTRAGILASDIEDCRARLLAKSVGR